MSNTSVPEPFEQIDEAPLADDNWQLRVTEEPGLAAELRVYLKSVRPDLSLGDITSRSYDRESYSPTFAQFVIEKAGEIQVPGSVSDELDELFPIERVLDRLRMLHLLRRAERKKFNGLEGEYERWAVGQESKSATIRVAMRLKDQLGDSESSYVAKDVLMALGAIAHTEENKKTSQTSTNPLPDAEVARVEQQL